MPPRTVLCDLCGGKFFASSLAHHKKVCRERVGVQNHECPYCHGGVPLLEMDAHIRKCPEAKAAGAKPTGASAALAARLQRDKERSAMGYDPAADLENQRVGGGGRGGGGGGFGGGAGSSSGFGGGGGMGPSEFADGGDDTRIACQVCGRKFAMDRVGKHQAVCTKIASKGPRKEFQVVRTYCEGGSSGAVIGVSAAPKTAGKRGPQGVEKGLASKPKPEPVKTNWRQQSEAFREAMKAAREYPMPRWGEDPPPQRRTSQPQARGGGGGGGGAGRFPPARGGGGGGAGPRQVQITDRSGPQSSPSRGRQPPARGGGGGGGGAPAPSVGATSPAAIAVKAQFASLDTDGDGTLDEGELAVFLRSLHPGMTDRDLRVLFGNIDKDRDGRVDFNEFVDFCFTGGDGDSGRSPKPAAGSAASFARQRPGATAGPAARGRGAFGGSPGGGGGRFVSDAPLPQWGSGAPSKYGRDCMTSPPTGKGINW